MTAWNYSIVFTALVFSFSHFASAEEKEPQRLQAKPYLMAAMGDSITAGLLARTQLDWFNSGLPLTQEAKEFNDLAIMSRQQYVSWIDWSAMFLKLFETRMSYSWATGSKINSHLSYLTQSLKKKEPAATLDVVNVAVSGGMTSDLIPQAEAVVAKMNTGQYASLKYLTLLIGNNDACTNHDFTEMRDDLRAVFSKLATIHQKDPIRILMSGLPRIPDLGQSSISQSKTMFFMSCESFRTRVTKICVPLVETWSEEADYLNRIQYVQAVNETLSQAADEANKMYKNLDIRFTDRLFDINLVKSELAVDCFHPTAASQERISQQLWQDQPWF